MSFILMLGNHLHWGENSDAHLVLWHHNPSCSHALLISNANLWLEMEPERHIISTDHNTTSRLQSSMVPGVLSHKNLPHTDTKSRMATLRWKSSELGFSGNWNSQFKWLQILHVWSMGECPDIRFLGAVVKYLSHCCAINGSNLMFPWIK